MRYKVTQKFIFSLPLCRKTVQNLRNVIEHEGDITISGLYYFHKNDPDSLEVNIEEINFNGIANLTVLDLTNIDQIEEAAWAHCTKQFDEYNIPEIPEMEPDSEPEVDMSTEGLFNMIANICRDHAKYTYGIDLDNGGKKP